MQGKVACLVCLGCSVGLLWLLSCRLVGYGFLPRSFCLDPWPPCFQAPAAETGLNDLRNFRQTSASHHVSACALLVFAVLVCLCFLCVSRRSQHQRARRISARSGKHAVFTQAGRASKAAATQKAGSIQAAQAASWARSNSRRQASQAKQAGKET